MKRWRFKRRALAASLVLALCYAVTSAVSLGKEKQTDWGDAGGWRVRYGLGGCWMTTKTFGDLRDRRPVNPLHTSSVTFEQFVFPKHIPKGDHGRIAKPGERIFVVSFSKTDFDSKPRLAIQKVSVDGKVALREEDDSAAALWSFVIGGPKVTKLWRTLYEGKEFQISVEDSTGALYEGGAVDIPPYDFRIKGAEFKACIGEVQSHKGLFRAHIDDWDLPE